MTLLWSNIGFILLLILACLPKAGNHAPKDDFVAYNKAYVSQILLRYGGQKRLTCGSSKGPGLEPGRLFHLQESRLNDTIWRAKYYQG